MRDFRISLTSIFFLVIAIGRPNQSLAGPIDEIVAAAKKEATLEFLAPSVLTPQGAQAIGAAFNKKYGLNIKLNYKPSNSFTADTAKLIARSAAGVPPEWDLMVVTDDHHANLWSRKLHLPFDYKVLGVDPKVIQHDHGSIVVVHGFYPPAYNNKVLAAKDVPRRWEDLLDPKWSNGKLGVSSATHHLARLAVGPWGEKKTTEFVKALEKQRPFLGTLAELYTRLQLGEILISVTLGDNMLARAKKTGAPVVPVKEIEPVVSAAVNAGVLKGSEHPNVAYLMAAFLTTPEAQNILEEYLGQTSAYIPGTTAYKFAKEKHVLFMDEKDAALVNKLSEEYAKILGFLGK